MLKFNPLDYPAVFVQPIYESDSTAIMHAPFAMVLAEMLRPAVIVEVGTIDGALYSALAQVVRLLSLNTECFAFLSDQLPDKSNPTLSDHHKAVYDNFSHVLNEPSEQAQRRFQEHQIDLLHISPGGLAGSVEETFAQWSPLLSSRGVLLVSSSNISEARGGASKFWQHVKSRYPNFELSAAGGIGVACIGPDSCQALEPLIAVNGRGGSLVREFFHAQGRRLCDRRTLSGRSAEIDQQRESYDVLTAEFQNQQRTFARLERDLNSILHSRAWRWVSRYGRFKNRIQRVSGRRLPTDETVEETKYRQWIEAYDRLTSTDTDLIRTKCREMPHRPLFSIILPVFNTDEPFLLRAIESVLEQIYPNWELCIADDCSTRPHISKILNKFARQDTRIKLVFRSQNGHIAAASNSSLDLATGEFVALLDHDDELAPHALYLVAEEINCHPEADLIYSDDDKITADGERYAPHFKGGWDPDLFYSMNYLSHLAVYRTSILRHIGGFRTGYDGSQDYDLALRFIEQIPKDHIRHIPYVLYHWRAVEGSVALKPEEKPYAHEAARRAIRSHFKRIGMNVTVSQGIGYFHRTAYPLPSPPPLVSLIVPTRDSPQLLRDITLDILERTSYAPLELIIVDNQSREPETLKFLKEIAAFPRVRVLEFNAPFNFSAINNFAVKEANGQLIGLLNNDLRVIHPEWLAEMVRLASRREVGAVGAKLYYPDETIQHAGIITNMTGFAGHPYKYFHRTSLGYFGRLHLLQNLSAVTAACIVMRREVFREVGGLDEVNLPIAYNDVDLCLRIRERGYRVVWTPFAELYHLESASRGHEDTPEKRERLTKEGMFLQLKWGNQFLNDPFYSPNLTLDSPDCSLAFPPRVERPWKMTSTQESD